MNAPKELLSYTAAVNQPEVINSLYKKNGFVLIRNAINRSLLNNLSSSINDLMIAKLQQLNSPHDNTLLDKNLERLAAFGNNKVESLLRASRETLAFQRLVTASDLLDLISFATTLSMPQIVSETCMLRIDRNVPSTRDFLWHYDASYTAHPPQSITCWIPITSVNAEMGPLRVIPGSHNETHPVRFHYESISPKLAGPRRIELILDNPDLLEEKAIDIYPLEVGDVVLLHGWTLHRSGLNESSRARWVFNPRYGDLLDRAILENEWRVSRTGEPWVFSEYYPNLVKE